MKRVFFLLVAWSLAACSSSGETPASNGKETDPRTVLQRAPDANLPSSVRTGSSMEARAADLDADGDRDLIIAREALANILLLNDGAGRFTDASDRIPRDVLDSEDVAVADFDRDGDPDIIISTEDVLQGRRWVEYYMNDGAARFTDARHRLPPSGEHNAVAAGDIDRDGDLDLVLSAPGREYAWMNDGSGTFTDESAARMPPAQDNTQDVALGDVDGDGDLDLLVGNDAGANQLLLNDGRGVFAPAPAGSLPGRQSPEVTRNADFGDADADGDLDVFFANASYGGGDPRSRLLLNDGAGRFTDASAGRLPNRTMSAFDGDFVDIDGDRDLDLLVAIAHPQGLEAPAAFLNDGQGRFTDASSAVFPAGLALEAIELEAADYNGDGRMDAYFSTYHRSADELLFGSP